MTISYTTTPVSAMMHQAKALPMKALSLSMPSRTDCSPIRSLPESIIHPGGFAWTDKDARTNNRLERVP
ncbi:hypothetical protein Rmf_35580 [Roseomonas fluvialis]|uniref:Uncharacterized protein n=1 Tax=Roseomonas fluvialis TaxID=1750527 RepID=A0ABM7Y6T3_9PROT|nr:hypothetical protein Rmf_35580 [Roseomonas fluvialis]